MTDRLSLPTLLTDLGDIIGGLPGKIVRYAAHIIRAQERENERVRERIDQERRTMIAAGQSAYHASRLAGNASKGSGAR